MNRMSLLLTLVAGLVFAIGGIAQEPDFGASLRSVQQAYEQQDFARAETLAKALTTQAPTRWEGHMLLGAALAKQGKVGAAEAFQAAKQRAPADKHAGIDELAKLAAAKPPAPPPPSPNSGTTPSGDDRMKVAIAKKLAAQLDGVQDIGRREGMLRDLLQKTDALPAAADARKTVLFVRALAALELQDVDVGWPIAKALRDLDVAATADEAQMDVLARLELAGWNKPDKPVPPVPAGFVQGQGAKVVKGYWNEIRHEATGAVLVLIPAGEFQMGSPAGEAQRDDDESLHRRVIRKPFYLGKTEVTQAQWRAVMQGTQLADPSHFKGADLPVEMVSWDHCTEFLQKAGGGLRLPSEAEWEYACRAGTTKPFSFGVTITPAQVNYNGNYPYGDASKGLYRERTVAAGSLPANAWGLHEMHGNVWEWCQDGYEAYPGSGTEEPSRAAGARVLRGGSWSHDASYCRAAYRSGNVPGSRGNDLGLRLARTLPE